LARADIVGLTGMTVQRARMLEILRELKTRDVFTIVGGPWVTVQEDYFEGLADAIFIGEAETTRAASILTTNNRSAPMSFRSA
jgi:B12 binding protein